MIDLVRGVEFAIVSVAHGEEADILHVGSARIDGMFVICHESLDVTCCEGMVVVVPTSSVTRIEVFADRAALDREIAEGGIGKTDGKPKITYSPEVG